QAEDGIRDFHVTGVQTCALPIYIPDMVGYVQRSTLPYDIRLSTWLRHKGLPCWHTVPSLVDHADYNSLIWDTNVPIRKAIITGRSEERRVGKECRSRGVRDHEKR